MRVVTFAFAGVALAAAGCAQSPDKIAPVFNTNLSYEAYSCNELQAERARVVTRLAGASARQKKTRTNDMIGVLLIGVPVSSMSGNDVGDEVAELKGQVWAIEQEEQLKGCEPGTNLAGA